MRVGKRVLVLLVALTGLGAFRAGPAAAVGTDLKIETSVSTWSPRVGSLLTYTHTVSLLAGPAATNVTLTDMLPPGTTFVSEGSDRSCEVDLCGSTVTCAIGPLSASASVAVAVMPNAGWITNVAGVAANEYDPVMTNNTSVVKLEVGAEATRCISGTIRLNQSGVLPDVLVQASGRSVWTDPYGRYQICGLSSGPHVVTPIRQGYTLSPLTQSVPAGERDETVDFDATANKYQVRGRVTLGADGPGLSGVTVMACLTSVATDSDGWYVTPVICTHGEVYPVQPSLPGYSFSPPFQDVRINAGNVDNVNFTASLQTYSISGTVTNGGGGLENVRVTAGSGYADTGPGGTYTIFGLPSSPTPYGVVPALPGHTFTPTIQSVTIAGESVSAIDFTAAPFTVLTISPTSGPTAGGTVVTLTGSGFQSGATVTFGGVQATNVIVDSPTTIRATTPPHPLAGVVPVVVTSSEGGVADSAQIFEYQPPAATNRFHPITPCRAVDTRNAAGPFGGPAFTAGTPRNYDLRGLCGIPATAQALELNFTVVGPNREGGIQVAPTGTPLNLDLIPFEGGMTRAQFLSVPLLGSTPGSFSVRAMPATANVHLVIDVFGYHAP